MDHYRRKLARVFAGEQPTMAEIVALTATVCLEASGTRRPSAFAACWGDAPAGPSLGQSVRWPDGSVSFTVGPHVPALCDEREPRIACRSIPHED